LFFIYFFLNAEKGQSNIKAIEDLINGYAGSEDSSFLIPNVTEDFFGHKTKWKSYFCEGISGNV